MLNRILFAVSTALTAVITMLPLTVCAAPPIPEKGVQRIKWAVECSGAMPKAMVIGIVITALLIIAAFVYATLKNGGAK